MHNKNNKKGFEIIQEQMLVKKAKNLTIIDDFSGWVDTIFDIYTIILFSRLRMRNSNN